MSLLTLALPVGAFVASLWLTGRWRRYALARQLLDVPNPRSSHSTPTPRGGGVAIIVTTSIAFVIAAWSGALEWRFVWGLVGGGALVGAIGFLDDLRPAGRRWR